MSMVVAPRRTCHRGFVAAAAFWFDPSLVGAARMADRILSLWREGCVLHAVADGVLLVLPSPVVVESRCGPGVVLTHRDGLLLGAPLTADEVSRLAPSPGSAVLCRGGRIGAHRLTRETLLDPADWLDVGSFVVEPSQPLGDPPSPVVVAAGIELAPLESHFAPELTSPPKEKKELLALFADAASRTGAAGNNSIKATLGRFVLRLLGHPLRRRQEGAAGEKRGPASRAERVSWLRRTFTPLRRMLGSWLFRSPAASYLGRLHTRYLQKLEALFDENNLDQALRYAIPLATLREMKGMVPALVPPKPRSDLSIARQPSRGARTSVTLTEEYFGNLRDRYREAAERLERAGEIDKAAFVLLELLQENEEAIALLERHRRFRFAAEVAQARGLPPGIVIRLWFLAGEALQAVRVARTTGSFADAVFRLQRTHPDDAKKLRLIWAALLAEAGNYGAAVDAAWAVREARSLILEWIERGIRLEGAIAARLMVKRIVLGAGSMEATLAGIRQIVRDTLPGGMRTRLSLGKAILEHENHPDLRELSGFVLRELLKDLRSVPPNPGFVSVVRGLERLTADRLLVEDLPSARPWAAERPSKERLAFRREAADAGLHRLYDGVRLPSGKLLVALGEAGVQVRSRRSALVAHLDCPADHLVVNDSGNRVIAVARRGEITRLARINLETLKAEYWCDARISTFASTYDGEVWFATHGDTLMAVDALACRFESIWHVTDLNGQILAMGRNSSALSLLVGVPKQPEHWTYELPGMALRRRYGMFNEDDCVRLWAVMPKGHYAVCRLIPGTDPGSGDSHVVRVGTEGSRAVWQSRAFEGVPHSLQIYQHLCVCTTVSAEGLRVMFFRWSDPPGAPDAQLDLVGARSATIRRYANTVSITDDVGHLLVVSPADLHIIREARI